MFRSLLLAASIVAGASAAQAQLYIVPQGGIIDTAGPETQSAGGQGFPLGVYGYQHNAMLYVATTNTYRFTYLGSGDSQDSNRFDVGGFSFQSNSSFGTPGGTGAGSTPIFTSFEVALTAGSLVPFTFTNLASECSISNGGDAFPADPGCHYLLALTDSVGPLPATGLDPLAGDGPQWVAYIGFADRHGSEQLHVGDHDFQDMTVRVEVVPEPGAAGLLALGLGALGWARRRRA